MMELNFPRYPFRFKSRENKLLVFDEVRKKYVVLQPEEWVRQHCLHFLIHDKGYPPGRILVERKLEVHGLTKRLDLAVCDPGGRIGQSTKNAMAPRPVPPTTDATANKAPEMAPVLPSTIQPKRVRTSVT